MIKWKIDYHMGDLEWVEPLLQGIAYWVGYKSQLYRHYPLSEGAIVGEAVSLIHGNSSVRLRDLEFAVVH